MDNDKVSFDKYMDQILIEEESRKAALRRGKEHGEDSPQREYVKRYRETPDNKTRWSGGGR